MARFARIPQVLAIAVAAGGAGCASDPDCGPDGVCVAVDRAPDSDPEAPGWGEPMNGPNTPSTSGDGPGFQDNDGDGFTPREGDCDDTDPEISPDALELCDEIDNDCDGMRDNGLGYTAVSENDYGADGVPDYISYTTYRSSGQLWFRELDTDADSVIDDLESYRYIYDALGRLMLTETDAWMDGSVDETKEYFYDALGRLERTEEDVGPDGDLDRIDTYLYDAATGARIQWDMDIDADMLVDTRYSYLYDATGQLESLVLDRFDDNLQITSSTIYAYHYDATGMIDRVDIDLTGDGIFDNSTDYVYDALGRMQEALTDLGRDLTIDSVSFYIYDAATGELSEIEMDTNNDGILDTRIRRWNECSDAENLLP